MIAMPTPFGWAEIQGTVTGAQTFRGVMPRVDGLLVIRDTLQVDGKEWRHVSFSRRSRTPSYDDMMAVHAAFCDVDAVVLQIFPKRAEWVNLHPHCLHLWQPLGFDPVADPHGERFMSVGGGLRRVARMTTPVCIHCDGWSCARCRAETLPAPLTDHDTAADVELATVTAERDQLRTERLQLRRALAALVAHARETEDGPLAEIVDAEELLACTQREAMAEYGRAVELAASRDNVALRVLLQRDRFRNALQMILLGPNHNCRAIAGAALENEP